MRRLGNRLNRVRAALPEPSPPEPPLDPTRLTATQQAWAARLQERWLAVGLSGLTYDELEEIIALRALLTAPPDGAE